MDTEMLQEVSLDPQTLEQLQNEISRELIEVLNKSQLGKVLEKYGISDTQVLKIQYTLDVNQLQSADESNGQVAIESFSIPKPPIGANLGLIQPCPFDGNPDGCWVYC
ncbi:hypothetical protein CLI64_08825 [Nostoc sp. CENA543]|uniref:hypothetical protein n=1 Tax=Nostoc sp. CENA543 TaxID=1869241 RepID=UPI000CA3088A|nr:hypothetical protein [Nostoc sp. CENA543]AUT00485.1 hypothetical protein CLI64_08825 [Nostoc sp. CENA543]